MTDRPASPISSRLIPFAIVIGLTLFSGVVHGYLDGRWSQATDLKAQGSLLDELPQSCGDWQVIASPGLDEGAAEMLRCFGSISRVYKHVDKDITVNVAIMFGPRGPIAVHTPEVCYDSVGTEQMSERKVETISTVQSNHELWSVPFSRRKDGSEFEVWYAWTDGGDRWQAVEHPRFWMTDNLYKIQLAGAAGQGADQPCRDFLEAFLPQVEKVIR